MVNSVLVAGAGLGGLTVATSLAKNGMNVDVFEQATVLGEVGAGIQLSPNATKVLIDLGLGAKLKEIAFEPQFMSMRHYQSGKRFTKAPLKSVCLNRYGAPYYHVHRADLHNLLADAAKDAGVNIHLVSKVQGYLNHSNSVELKIENRNSKFADLLVGSDGVKSIIQNQMLGNQKVEFTGQVAWRAVIPTEKLPKNLIEPGVTIWIGSKRHMVIYYVRGGALVNVAAFEERDDWKDESWTTPGNINEFRAAFSGWHKTVQTIVNSIDSTFIWALYGRQELSTWVDGNTVLLGDSCHPTLPYMAQGAAMAIEDSCVLTRALLKFPDNVKKALMLYENHRKPRTSYLQQRARDNAKMFHLKGPFGGISTKLKLQLVSMLPVEFGLKPFDKVYSYNPLDVAI